eukprot:m51a1_g2775 hypothetical protein (542) ;mRNA; f:1037000-1039273
MSSAKPTVPGNPDIILDYRFSSRPLQAGGTVPERRCWHASAVQGRYVYVSGGYSGYGYYGDLHIFDTVTREWVVQAADVTKPRYAHSCSAIGPSIYLYGGARERIYYKFFNALPSDPATYKFEPQAVRSADPGAVGPGPSERAAHGSAVVDGKLYVFGGDAGKGVYYNDVYVFDPKTDKWTMLAVKGQTPTPRGWCSLCAVGNRLYVLFGTNGNDVYNDVYYLDLDTNTWVKPTITGPEPHPRHSQGACAKGNCIYVFGGVGERKRQLLNDVWVFVASANTWVQATVAAGQQAPSPRYGHSTVFTGREMFVFGGCLLDPSGTRSYSNDILLINFELRPSLKGIPSNLSANLSTLVNSDSFSDITFIIENKRVFAHKCILAARNRDFFQKMFLGPLRESTAREIPIPDVRYPVFVALLEYIYTGKVAALSEADKEPLDTSTMAVSPRSATTTPHFQLAIELLEAAHMYNLQPLERLCCQHLVERLSPDTALDVWQFAAELSIGALEEVCLQYMRSRNEALTPTMIESVPPDLRPRLTPLMLS